MYAYSIRLHIYIYIYTHIVYVYNQLYNYINTQVNVNPPSLGSLKELVEKYKVFVRSRRFIVSLSLSRRHEVTLPDYAQDESLEMVHVTTCRVTWSLNYGGFLWT